MSIRAGIDVGFGNGLFIRGDGAGLSWGKGRALDCQGDAWTLVLSGVEEPFEFKLLINDTTWSADPNYRASPGDTSHAHARLLTAGADIRSVFICVRLARRRAAPSSRSAISSLVATMNRMWMRENGRGTWKPSQLAKRQEGLEVHAHDDDAGGGPAGDDGRARLDLVDWPRGPSGAIPMSIPSRRTPTSAPAASRPRWLDEPRTARSPTLTEVG